MYVGIFAPRVLAVCDSGRRETLTAAQRTGGSANAGRAVRCKCITGVLDGTTIFRAGRAVRCKCAGICNQKKTRPKPGFNNARNRGSCSASFGVAPHLGGAAATLNRHEYLIDVVLQIRYPFRGGPTCPFRPCRQAAFRHGCAPHPSEPRQSSPLSSTTDRQRTPRSATRDV
jgi:hypothetical protein